MLLEKKDKVCGRKVLVGGRNVCVSGAKVRVLVRNLGVPGRNVRVPARFEYMAAFLEYLAARFNPGQSPKHHFFHAKIQGTLYLRLSPEAHCIGEECMDAPEEQ